MEPTFGLGVPLLSWAVIIPLASWSMVWKAIALWKAARRDHLAWYVVLLVINTVGILEIVYIFAVAPRRPELGASRRESGAI